MKRIALAAAAVVALALALWFAFDSDAPSSASARPSAQPFAASPTPQSSAPTPSAEQLSDASNEPAASPEAPQREAIESAPSTAEPSDTRKGKLIVRLSNGAGGPAPHAGTITVALPSGKRTARIEGDGARVEFERVEPGEWPVTIRASGFHDHELVAQVAWYVPSEVNLKLWPVDWVLVRAVTTLGEPYTEISRRLGVPPAALFEGGFQVWTSIDAPVDLLSYPATPPLERGEAFSRVSHLQANNDFDLRDIARVKRVSSGPVWIALAFHQRFFGWAQLAANVNVAQFELADEDITAQFGSLAFRVVEPGGGASVRDARASLDAEQRGLSRADTSDLRPDELGGFAARRLLPGEYELTVDAPRRGEHRQRVQIHVGEQLDLGEIALDFAEQLVIRVLDPVGQPTLARVQLGEWRAGARVEDCIRARAWVTGDGGSASVPMPSGKIVLRAERMSFDTGGRIWSNGVGAAVAVFDPATRATEVELRLTNVRLALLVPPPERGSATQLRVLDRFEIGVAQRALDTERPLEFTLAPGSYAAALLDEEEHVVARYPFEVKAGVNEPIALQ